MHWATFTNGSAVLPQKRNRGCKLLAEAVDFLERAGEAEAGTGGSRHAVVAVQRLTAVMTTADADP